MAVILGNFPSYEETEPRPTPAGKPHTRAKGIRDADCQDIGPRPS